MTKFEIKEMRGDQVLTRFELIEGQQARHASYFLKNIAGKLKALIIIYFFIFVFFLKLKVTGY
jgi:hypothetical protein